MRAIRRWIAGMLRAHEIGCAKCPHRDANKNWVLTGAMPGCNCLRKVLGEWA